MESLQTIRNLDLMDLSSRSIDLAQPIGQLTSLSRDEIFELIDVLPPYYALKDVAVSPGNFAVARIRTEQPLGHEVFPISTSEASRHMAILGSVCCAVANPVKQKHYYLANTGTFTRGTEDTFWIGNELIVMAECLSFGKRGACVRACLLNHQHQLICGIDVSYHVIHHSLFERIYTCGNAGTPSGDFGRDNPYTTKNPLADVSISDTGASAWLREITSKNCQGHFPKFPTLPVAILVASVFDLIIMYIHHLTGDRALKVLVRESTLLAENLAFSGETVELHARLQESSGNRFKVQCVAQTTDGKNIGDVIAIIETVRNNFDMDFHL
ncbi:hypothetical protein SAMN05216327_11810 [Dyadobacter sp. SG02]|uniref:hypothetical protein n=1 Tax=Dyadobacter sp. SG02 TaxID=1855291 RepID=UPI0008D1A50A|nr:hypothetical protein [Dyadobacter sp. SG02]SEJ74360.1 hypothetical protein SAMN05216327_11810 [Dyadobacter sp. SG02]